MFNVYVHGYKEVVQLLKFMQQYINCYRCIPQLAVHILVWEKLTYVVSSNMHILQFCGVHMLTYCTQYMYMYIITLGMHLIIHM